MRLGMGGCDVAEGSAVDSYAKPIIGRSWGSLSGKDGIEGCRAI